MSLMDLLKGSSGRPAPNMGLPPKQRMLARNTGPGGTFDPRRAVGARGGGTPVQPRRNPAGPVVGGGGMRDMGVGVGGPPADPLGRALNNIPKPSATAPAPAPGQQAGPNLLMQLLRLFTGGQEGRPVPRVSVTDLERPDLNRPRPNSSLLLDDKVDL